MKVLLNMKLCRSSVLHFSYNVPSLSVGKSKAQYSLWTTYVNSVKFTHTHKKTSINVHYILVKWLWKFRHFITSFPRNTKQEKRIINFYVWERHLLLPLIIIISPYVSIKLCNLMVHSRIAILLCRSSCFSVVHQISS